MSHLLTRKQLPGKPWNLFRQVKNSVFGCELFGHISGTNKRFLATGTTANVLNFTKPTPFIVPSSLFFPPLSRFPAPSIAMGFGFYIFGRWVAQWLWKNFAERKGNDNSRKFFCYFHSVFPKGFNLSFFGHRTSLVLEQPLGKC